MLNTQGLYSGIVGTTAPMRAASQSGFAARVATRILANRKPTIMVWVRSRTP